MDELNLKHFNTQAERLRAVLADGEWHEGPELDERVGWRFGAAIQRIRNGWDGCPPWYIAKERVTADGRIWRYKFERLALAEEIKPKPSTQRVTWKMRALRAEAELERIQQERQS
jgi:hypothetical protein